MTKWKTILYTLAWVAYVAFSLTMFPRWNSNVVIPLIPLLALGGWIYGRTRGLVLIIPAIVYHILLFSVIHADRVIYYEDKVAGPLMAIIVVLLTGSLRKNLDAIKETNIRLDRLVAERSAELDALAARLIARSEETRSSLGQELHDGIGQLLTGIKLYCTSLSDRLHAEQSPCALMTDSIMGAIGKTHEQIRRIARTLFPIQIGQVGLISALRELSACFHEINHVQFDVEEAGNLPELPERTALQLYRICQETALFALDTLKADQIAIRFSSEEKVYILEFAHNGLPLRFDDQNHALLLLEYRLHQISVKTESRTVYEGRNKTIFTIPHPEEAAKS